MTTALALAAACIGMTGVAAADSEPVPQPRKPVVKTSLETAGRGLVTLAEKSRPAAGPSAAWVRVRSLYGGGVQCLDADINGGGGNGNRVQVWTCNGLPQQRWFSADNGMLMNGRFPGMCLDADVNGGGLNGTRLQLWQCSGATQQLWGALPNDFSLYNFRFLNNFTTVVDRNSLWPGDGAGTHLWGKNFQPQQWWVIEPV
ncbi:RICIN domain-containing protein [Streptomyces sp. NPDC020965]|uniref:RICIN domain-containing protein n=1 Tax=Streptomyces sp. NPDC020965 TaxID=3365105 RepID=UPI0037962043